MTATRDLTDVTIARRAVRLSPAAPQMSCAACELDGYLTAVILTSTPLSPMDWMPPLWNDNPTRLDDPGLPATITACHELFMALEAAIDDSLGRLLDGEPCDYLPAFLTDQMGPLGAAVDEWITGFWQACLLAPDDWLALAEDERAHEVIAPFVILNPAFREHPDKHDRADAIDRLPQAILVTRLLKQFRTESAAAQPVGRFKPGRNDPCPCGSGKKYKRCCIDDE